MAKPTPEPDEAISETSISLLQRAQRNDADAWAQFVELYGPMVYTICRRRWSLAAADAEGVSQDVFLAVARKLAEFDRQRLGSLRTWLRKIADRKCLDFLRKRRPTADGGSANDRKLKAIPDIEEPEDDYEQTARELVMQQAIRSVEQEFSERDWRIFWGVAVDDRHRQDLAEEHNVTDNVVYLAVSRIRKRLKEAYEDLLDNDLTEPPE